MADEGAVTVSFTDLTGSPTDGFDAEGRFFARRTLRCAWADRITLMQQLKGGFRNDDTGTRVLPATYPPFPEARVLTVNARPQTSSQGADTLGMNSYEYALVDVAYNIRQSSFQTSSKNDFSWSSSSGNEFLNIAINKNQKPLFYRNTGTRADQNSLPQVLKSIWQWHLTILEIPTVTLLTQTLQGQVNDAAIASTYLPRNSSFTWPIESFRYDSADLSETVTVDGDERWNVTLHFSYINLPVDDAATPIPGGWNHAFAPANDTPTIVTIDAAATTQYRMYTAADLNSLLDGYL